MNANQSRSEREIQMTDVDSPFTIGSINLRVVLPQRVEKIGHPKNRPIGFRAASNPERTAAPLPRFGNSQASASTLASSIFQRAMCSSGNPVIRR